MYSSLISVLAFAAMVIAKTISIDVGKGGTLAFAPDSIKADVGDTLEFQFYNGSGPHSAVMGTYETPCVAATGGFSSDFIVGNSIGNQTFTTSVNNTDPIWFYCSARKHCQGGMVGVVNPPSNATVSDYANAARGGVAATTSSGTGGASATSSAKPASSSKASGAGKGMGVDAVLGMAVAGVAALFV